VTAQPNATQPPVEGQEAPDFELPDQDGTAVKLSDFRGGRVVLYFYPKDDTSGCTKQACELREAHETIETRNAVVLGVSPDDEASHRRFRAKYDLPFRLLADTDHAIAERYGVWQEKTLYGRKYMGVVRSTFVIGADGRIEKAMPNVTSAGHADRILELI
jgi:peroxiredoxin Q/BCP